MNKLILSLLVFSFSFLSADLTFTMTDLNEGFKKTGIKLQPRAIDDNGEIVGFVIKKNTPKSLFVRSSDGTVTVLQSANDLEIEQFTNQIYVYGNGEVVGIYESSEDGMYVKKIYRVIDNKIVDVPHNLNWKDLWIKGVNNNGVLLLADRNMRQRQTKIAYARITESGLEATVFSKKDLDKVIAITDTHVVGIYHPTFHEKVIRKTDGYVRPHFQFKLYNIEDKEFISIETPTLNNIFNANNNDEFLAVLKNSPRQRVLKLWSPHGKKHKNIGPRPQFKPHLLNDQNRIIFKNRKNLWALWRDTTEKHQRGPLRGFIVGENGKPLRQNINVMNVISMNNKGSILIKAKVKGGSPSFYLLTPSDL